MSTIRRPSAEEISAAQAEYDRLLRWMNSPANGATTATLGARNDAEQRFAQVSKILRSAGVIPPLKRKYRR